MPEQDPVVIFHAGCTDGSAAALAAYLKLGEHAVYLPVSYGERPPMIEELAGRSVYILDFCYPRPVIEELAGCCDLTVLDHHKTHAEELQGFGDAVHFDLDHSGAVLAYQHFFPDRPVPELFLYVEDRDLWRFDLPDSKAVSAALRAHGGQVDFRSLMPLLDRWERGGRDDLVRDGHVLLKLQAELVKTMVARAERVVLEGVEALASNATVVYSEVAEALWMKLPPMGIAWFWDGKRGRYQVSLRCQDGFDVASIATRYGGGGHPRAAAFLADELPWRT